MSVTSVKAQDGVRSNLKYLRDNIQVSARIPSDYIQFDIRVPETQWVGFGFGYNMSLAEMFVLEYINQTSTVTDFWSTVQDRPLLKDQNNYRLTSFIHTNGYYNYKVLNMIIFALILIYLGSKTFKSA